MIRHDAELPRGACHVWWARAAPGTAGGLPPLAPDERARVHRFRRPADRLRYAIARGLARAVVSAVIDKTPETLHFAATCRRCGGPHGKPGLPGTGIELSWSHSGRYVVLAVAREVSVGVDVEDASARRHVPELADEMLSEAEHRYPQGSADLLRTWVRKEAVLKATGDGLTVPLHSLTVSSPIEPAALLGWAGRPALPDHVHLHDLRAIDGGTACVALLGERPHTVTEFQWPRGVADVTTRPSVSC